MEPSLEEVAALRRVITRKEEEVSDLRYLVTEILGDRDPRWLPLSGKLRRILDTFLPKELLKDDVRRRMGTLTEENCSAMRNMVGPAIMVRGDTDPDIRNAAEQLITAHETFLAARDELGAALNGHPSPATPRMADSLRTLLMAVLDRNGQDLDRGLCERIEEALGAP